ncbi:hypothetical protein QTP88_009943 [Uroleucon formosanum]
MADGKCTKNFPKDFTNNTITNVDGYPIYRRRNSANSRQSFIKNISNTDIDIDNRWVVPYSPLAANSNEAVWRIFGFYIHERDPAVVQLAVHLENGQRVFFTNETAIDRAINIPKTTLTYFFELCNRADDFGAFARTLLYSQVLRYFTWAQTKKWMPCKQGSPVDACLNLFKSNTMGRIFTVNSRQTVCFYLRLLLVNVTGTLSFLDKRNVNGQQYPTYKDACLALELLEDDNQWECMLTEAALNYTSIQICLLFAIELTTCFPARAEILWDNYKDSMTDDMLHQHRTQCNDQTITFHDVMYNKALIAIEDLCIIIANLPLSHFGMNSPNLTASDLMNTKMNRELRHYKLFGGTLLVLSGDFRQTLPVILRSTYADEINACLKSSSLWRNIKKLQLKVNMRVQMLQDPSAETFSKQLLDIGDGKLL